MTNNLFERGKFDPAGTFASPNMVLEDKTLTRDQKIIILQSWAMEERELSVATEENMPNRRDERDILSEISKALLELGVNSDHGHASPTKHG